MSQLRLGRVQLKNIKVASARGAGQARSDNPGPWRPEAAPAQQSPNPSRKPPGQGGVLPPPAAAGLQSLGAPGMTLPLRPRPQQALAPASLRPRGAAETPLWQRAPEPLQTPQPGGSRALTVDGTGALPTPAASPNLPV